MRYSNEVLTSSTDPKDSDPPCRDYKSGTPGVSRCVVVAKVRHGQPSKYHSFLINYHRDTHYLDEQAHVHVNTCCGVCSHNQNLSAMVTPDLEGVQWV